MNNSADGGWNASAEAWIRCIENGDNNRVHLLDPAVLKLCGTIQGKEILDVGCGEGRFCRLLAERGAVTTGIDPTGRLLEMARAQHSAGTYVAGMAEQLPFADNRFDLVLSYITLVDIPGYVEAIREMVRVLRPGGALVLANLTGFATATERFWERGPGGEKLWWTMDNYMIDRPVWAEWAGIRVINYHRPLSSYMKAFLDAGLLLEVFDEPAPAAGQVAAAPELADSFRKPDFVVMRWRKQSAS